MDNLENLEEKNTISFSIEDIRAYHTKVLSGNFVNIDSMISQLVRYYLSLPIKSPLKKPLRLLLKDADGHSSLLPYLSGVVAERVSSLSDDLFSVVEECIENLPGGQKCVENLLHIILPGMNKFFVNNIAEPLRIISRIKCYHKTIVKCQSLLRECLASHASVTQEYHFIRNSLIYLSRDCGLPGLNEQDTGSQFFLGIVRLMRSDEEDISQTAIFVNILQMRSLVGKEEFLQDIELIVSSIEPKIHIYNLRIMLGILSTSPSDILYVTPENPFFVTLTERIHTSLSTEQLVASRLLLCRCLHACVVALSRSVACCPLYRTALLRAVADTGGVRETIVSIIMNNWDSYSELIRHSIRSIFEEFLALLSLVFGSDSLNYFEELANSFLLLDVKLTAKYKYLSLLSSYIPLNRWTVLDPLLPNTLLSIMDECALATHAGEFWSRLMSQEYLQFTDIQPWIDSLLSTISRVSETHSRNIVDYCKKGLISSHPDILQYVASHTAATDQGLLFLVQCHKQAQKQLVHCGTINLSLEQLAFSLNTSSSDLSLSVLELISKSHRSTAVVSEEDLNLVLKGLTLLIGTSSTSCRKNLIATFKVLIDRIEKSSHKFFQHLKSDDSRFSLLCINHYSVFLSSLSSLLFAYLNPGSPCGAIEVVLSLLSPLLHLYLSNAMLFPPDFSISDLDLERLLSALNGTYESHCRMALDALLILKNRLSIWLDSNSNYGILSDEMFSLMLSPVSVHSTSASYFLRLLFIIEPYRLCDLIRSRYPQIPQIPSYVQENIAPIEADCLLILMELLVLQLRNSQDQWDPIQHCFYSILRCIRRLLVDENSLVNCPTRILQYCFDKLTLLCSEVLAITGPIVCCSSPEGILQPPYNGVGGGDIHSHNSRALLLCSWQSLKEISILYSEIVELVIPNNPSLCDSGILSRIYEFFLNYLMEARHKGAFELTYVGFSKLCKVLWLSPMESVSSLPSIWLESVLNSLSNKENESTQLKLLSCATRRSAGLPFLVLAILANEPQQLKNKCLFHTIGTLITLTADTPHSPDEFIVKVHCLNIMRALFKDNKLRDSMHQFVAPAIKLVTTCVVSRHWPIRNASHLLFSSILARVFGVKRIQDEHAWQNKLTLNSFFSRYSNLLDLFIQKLNSSALNSCQIQPDYSIFIILTILSRLYISKSEVSSLPENAFILPLFSLSENPSWKLREMCAHAVCSLLYSHPFLDVFHTLQRHLLTLTNSPPQNRIHGFLLILKEFIQTQYSRLAVEETITLFKFCIELIPICENGIANHCILMQIIRVTLSQSSAHLISLSTNLSSLYSHLSNNCKTFWDSTLKSWDNNLLMQTQITSNIELALTLLNRLDSKQQLLSSGLVHIVASFLDRSDTRYYCIQSMIEHPIHSFNGFPVFKLFPLIISSNNFEKFMCLKAMLLIHDHNLETLAQELAETSLDLKGAFTNVLQSSTDYSIVDESQTSVIMFSGCLVLALNSQHRIETETVDTLIHFMYETALDLQDPSTLSYISSTASSIYHIIVPQHSQAHMLDEWYFLLLYIIQQDKSTPKLSLLLTSTHQNCTHISHSDFPQNPHPNILTKLLLESVTKMHDEIQTINILLFILGNYPVESDSGTEEERESGTIFEETTQKDYNQPDIVLNYILRLMEKLVTASEAANVLIEAIHLRYLEYQEQELDGSTCGVRWNRKNYITNLKCSILGYILNKWKHELKSRLDECFNVNRKYLAFLPFEFLFS